MSLPTEMLLTNAVGQKGELGTAQRIGTSGGGGGGGGEVTPASIVDATGEMTASQALQTRTNLGIEAHEIRLDEIPTPPYPIIKSEDEYICDLSSLSGSGANWVTIYCDPSAGNDDNPGTNPTAPVKTYTRAEYRMRQQMNNGNNVVIQIADGAVFYNGDYQYTSPTKSAIIRANNNCTFVNGVKPVFTISNNHYESEALTAYTPIGCVEMGEKDDFGLFIPLTKKTSILEVDSTPGSFFIDTTNKISYVNPANNINSVAVMVSNNYAIELSCASMNTSNFVMFENINVVGRISMQARATSDLTEDKVKNLILKNCTFQHAFTGNAVSIGDFENTYIIDCTTGYTYLDGFNYHFTKKPTKSAALVVEVNTKGKEAGYYNPAGSSDQVSTCHEGANILRCNTRAEYADSSPIYDADGCVSVLLDCVCVNNANLPAYRFASTGNLARVKMQNCFGCDTQSGVLVSVEGKLELSGMNAGGTITANTITISKTNT